MSSNIGNIAGGHKANLRNPNTSEDAKDHSRQVLEDLDREYDAFESQKNEGNVIGGHKATLKNPRVSEEAKEHSREILEDKEEI
ncbi:hypothetical protein EW145_g103 [Phellinidium pouzarii]|uniref:Conidiation protein 6 n=1 Tax=Phellinidium pouzarii TaxID=167371 RepID=A0A4S4LQ48_9AGAM|nr:hypothetical protein EW145_g103 [Phellinidium pouzarii]